MLVSQENRQLEPDTAQSLIGTWRRFGVSGPLYQIVGMSEAEPKHDLLMRVRVAHTGEEIDYPMSQLLGDPQEH